MLQTGLCLDAAIQRRVVLQGRDRSWGRQGLSRRSDVSCLAATLTTAQIPPADSSAFPRPCRFVLHVPVQMPCRNSRFMLVRQCAVAAAVPWVRPWVLLQHSCADLTRTTAARYHVAVNLVTQLHTVARQLLFVHASHCDGFVFAYTVMCHACQWQTLFKQPASQACLENQDQLRQMR